MATEQKWHIKGMHCASCERRVKDLMEKEADVKHADVSIRKKTVVVVLENGGDAEACLTACNRLLQEGGYQLSAGGEEDVEKKPWGKRLFRAGVAILGVWLLVQLFRPIIEFMTPEAGTIASLGGIFLLGVIASLSSCLVTTGGFLMTYAAGASFSRRTLIFLHTGRLVAFMVGGFVLGSLGSALPGMSPGFYAVVALALGLAFLIVSLNLFDLAPSFASLGIKVPSRVFQFAERIQKSPKWFAPFAVGAVTFVLPCGFTQTAQALALASGSGWSGAWLLFAFALGTAPVLIGMTVATSAKTLQNRWARVAGGAVLFLFALTQLNSAFALFGLDPSSIFPPSQPTKSAKIVPGTAGGESVQRIQMEVTGYGYQPSSFTLKKGVPVRWEIYAERPSGCTRDILSRPLGIYQLLEKGTTVIEFTPNTAGRIPFSCGMGMIRGTFNIVE